MPVAGYLLLKEDASAAARDEMRGAGFPIMSRLTGSRRFFIGAQQPSVRSQIANYPHPISLYGPNANPRLTPRNIRELCTPKCCILYFS